MRDWCSECKFETYDGAEEPCINCVKTYNEKPSEFTPAIDEARGVGKWEQKEIYGVEETTIEQMQSACCSVCRKYHTTPYLYYFYKYNYCPNCGAKMEVSE